MANTLNQGQEQYEILDNKEVCFLMFDNVYQTPVEHLAYLMIVIASQNQIRFDTIKSDFGTVVVAETQEEQDILYSLLFQCILLN